MVLVAGEEPGGDLGTWRRAAASDLGPEEDLTWTWAPGVIVGKRETKGGRERGDLGREGRREIERARTLGERNKGREGRLAVCLR